MYGLGVVSMTTRTPTQDQTTQERQGYRRSCHRRCPRRRDWTPHGQGFDGRPTNQIG